MDADRGGFDPADGSRRLASWILERARDAGASGAVYGLSGGVDSAVVGALCKKAFPGDSLALILPCESLPEDIEDARFVAERLGLPFSEVSLDAAHSELRRECRSCFQKLRGAADEHPGLLKAEANLKPRLRMAVLYYFANLLNYLVVGTSNKSELSVGYFTKYGDGGADILPLGGLVKWQVKELARCLGVPARIIDKPPTAGLWRGQTDEAEMGLSYSDLDRFLTSGNAPSGVKEKILEMAAKSQHKRMRPPIPDFP